MSRNKSRQHVYVPGKRSVFLVNSKWKLNKQCLNKKNWMHKDLLEEKEKQMDCSVWVWRWKAKVRVICSLSISLWGRVYVGPSTESEMKVIQCFKYHCEDERQCWLKKYTRNDSNFINVKDDSWEFKFPILWFLLHKEMQCVGHI